MVRKLISTVALVVAATCVWGQLPLKPQKDEVVVAVGGGLGERMLYYPHFETDLHMAFPKA
ncbi:MAG: hypothetical protein AAGB46_17235, partial [Verrucomicrobiota bacterium]